MNWLGSDHVGTPTDTHAMTEELCFLCVVHAERIQETAYFGCRVVEREREWSEYSAVKKERFG
jgi:hypothetical protein